eukprot:4502559-Karenia_brevis.AAC.1
MVRRVGIWIRTAPGRSSGSDVAALGFRYVSWNFGSKMSLSFHFLALDLTQTLAGAASLPPELSKFAKIHK